MTAPDAVDPALGEPFTAETIERCCAIKARIVGLDERESVAGGPRALLNLGHTFGHAIETHTGYSEWLHGEAVAAGMCMAADLSHRMGWIKSSDLERVTRLIGRAGLPTTPPDGMTPAGFRDLMGLDKKVRPASCGWCCCAASPRPSRRAPRCCASCSGCRGPRPRWRGR